MPAAAWWAAVVMGFLAVAILVANNLRDIPTDQAARQAYARGSTRRPADANAVPDVRRRGVRAVVLGVAVFIADGRSGCTQWALFALAAWPLAIRPVEQVANRDRPRPDPGADRNGGDARGVRAVAGARSQLWRAL